ncbi:DUF1887 family CARF protein [Parabacteroides sp. PF5-9]|uniref:Card1-like endonuclease domain-containing protein n=1 Tax=Parabacteroides sp. PF5-9 TaxID=1742404 RepID=UPI0024770C85|nr:DUF1887 family CARF protein [Parabacteroides sp. PF5-9]MDH6358836.1 hypothetical protein [Parabacteroides sp. PF5-9]
MKHQLILLGKDISSVYHGIKEFAPDCIHLLYTDETREIADNMFPLLPDSIQYKMYKTEPYNGNQVMEICREIHRHYSGEFMYHLSEGTKPMALAAYQVAKELGIPSFYLTQLGELVWLDSFEKREMHSTLDNEEILKLSGNTLSGYHDIKNLDPEDIQGSYAIKHFIETYPHDHARLMKFFGIFCQRQTSHLPTSKVFASGLRFKQKEGAFIVTQKNKVLLRISHSNGIHLYFKGSWWETLVANQVRIWSERKKNAPEIWQNVIFQTGNAKNQAKNEVDVLVNNKQKLIFIECKSGQITQNDIYKMDGVRETYGGDISRAVLASYYPLDHSLQEKCKDLQIHLFAPAHVTERFEHIEQMPDWLDQMTLELQL